MNVPFSNFFSWEKTHKPICVSPTKVNEKFASLRLVTEFPYLRAFKSWEIAHYKAAISQFSFVQAVLSKVEANPKELPVSLK